MGKEVQVHLTTKGRHTGGDWSYRHGAAAERAKRIQRQATILGEDLVRLSICEGDHETVLRAIQALLEELLEAQRLVLEFDCVDQMKDSDEWFNPPG